MIGKQIINNAQEIFVPKMKAWWQKKQASMGTLNAWKRLRKARHNVTALFLWLLNDQSQLQGLYSIE
jgi:hypothetical protein